MEGNDVLCHAAIGSIHSPEWQAVQHEPLEWLWQVVEAVYGGSLSHYRENTIEAQASAFYGSPYWVNEPNARPQRGDLLFWVDVTRQAERCAICVGSHMIAEANRDVTDETGNGRMFTLLTELPPCDCIVRLPNPRVYGLKVED